MNVLAVMKWHGINSNELFVCM